MTKESVLIGCFIMLHALKFLNFHCGKKLNYLSHASLVSEFCELNIFLKT
jgi:hypothetical protein